ncbi:MotA/TolQ/ExbB proton channel family protein [Confluentibacter sediminis]|uniref:MotA/TolQ/ExbB proton channel family protein n=1 Tax=Confluentibacter sediminis TaxID=2219045 RepID=UPI000DAC94AC|nr:MotA/TolQ/ExbB proton channel family protein [Confluentibacter sediminis]
MKTLFLITQNSSRGNVFVQRFHEGGPFFMSLILISLLLSIFFLIRAALSLNKNEAKFKKMISLVSEMSLLGLVLGVLASIIGLITAFDTVDGSGDMSKMAGGLKVTFLTMLFGTFTFIVSRIGMVILKGIKKA